MNLAVKTKGVYRDLYIKEHCVTSVNRKGTRVGVSYMYGNNKITSGQYRDFDLGAKTHVLSGYVTHPLIDNEKGE